MKDEEISHDETLNVTLVCSFNVRAGALLKVNPNYRHALSILLIRNIGREAQSCN